VSLWKQELLALPEHLRSSGFNRGSCCSIFCFMCNVLYFVVCLFVFFHLVIVMSRFTATNYPFGIFKLLAMVLSALFRFTASEYPMVSSNYWPLHCMFLFDLQLLITLLVSSNYWPLHCMFLFDLQLLITLLVSIGHCIVCPSSTYGF
jgi:hypothetical protein